MPFSERLKILENLLHQDTERCLLEIAAKSFTSSLFYPELKALVNMFEGTLQKKTTQSKHSNQAKQALRPQIIIGFYSVIIMRSSVINIKYEHTSAIATKIDPQADSIYNSKLAIETLSKIYRGLEEHDQTRPIICGLLLKIRGFNNYKLIVKDVSPLYVSDQTMSLHFESLNNQCPNLLETQLVRHKLQWAKYLRYKPVSLSSFQQLLDKIIANQSQGNYTQQTDLLTQLEEETAYVLKRFELISESSQSQKINLEGLTTSIDGIYAKLVEKMKQTTVSIKKSAKGDQLQPEYDSRQELHKNYLKIFNNLLKIINVSISSLHLNWFRKIKWLYSFISNLFINFDIKGANFHQSIAQEYSKILLILVQIMVNYLLTFKSGLFPQDKLTELAFSAEYSIYKLIQCFLYNEYPFEQEEAVKYQNYQKQRKHHENKNKQHVIDIVNFNMKSLNINIHWDTMLIKVIPHLKNSILFGKTIVNLSLYFILRYFQITNNYQEAAKFLLMVANAKNTIFTSDKNPASLIRRIKNCVYSDRQEIKQRIEYFCEDYFQEQLKYDQKRIQRMEEEEAQSNRVEFFQLCKTDSIHIDNANQVTANNFKKTESYDAIIQGWDNYDSIRDSMKDHSGESLKESGNRQMNMFQSVDSENNEMFYSINQSKHQKMMEAIKSQKQVQGEVEKVAQKDEDNQILLPQF